MSVTYTAGYMWVCVRVPVCASVCTSLVYVRVYVLVRVCALACVFECACVGLSILLSPKAFAECVFECFVLYMFCLCKWGVRVVNDKMICILCVFLSILSSFCMLMFDCALNINLFD